MMLEKAKELAAQLGREVISEQPITLGWEWPGRHRPDAAILAREVGALAKVRPTDRHGNPMGGSPQLAIQVSVGELFSHRGGWYAAITAFAVGPTAEEIAEEKARREQARREIEQEQARG